MHAIWCDRHFDVMSSVCMVSLRYMLMINYMYQIQLCSNPTNISFFAMFMLLLYVNPFLCSCMMRNEVMLLSCKTHLISPSASLSTIVYHDICICIYSIFVMRVCRYQTLTPSKLASPSVLLQTGWYLNIDIALRPNLLNIGQPSSRITIIILCVTCLDCSEENSRSPLIIWLWLA